MFLRICTIVVSLLIGVSIQGCATKQSIPEVSAELGNKGLLVARLYVLGLQSMENANINIDGKFMPSSLRDGYIVASLEPGEHTLSQIRAAGQLLGKNVIEETSPIRQVRGGGSAPTYIYVPGNTYTVHYTTLSIDRKFKIEPGKVTNLGLLVYLPANTNTDPNKKLATVDSSREFNVVTLDNRAAINAFLETNYPDVMRNLKSREITLAPGKYLEEAKLPDLRRAIAYHESSGPHVISSPKRTVVYGRAGTVVSLTKQATNDKPQIDVLDTGTLADVVGATRNGEQFTFLTSDATLLAWDGSNITRQSLPYQVQPVKFQSLGQEGLLVVDNRMRVLTSRSINDQWNNYEGAMIKIPRNDMNIASDNEGAYITLGNYGFPESVYYLKSGESVPRPITSPENKAGISTANWNVVIARESGLFVLFDKRDYFFWSKDKQKWALYSKPAGTCKPMKIDKGGAHLTIECDGIDYRSGNHGASWTKATT